MPIRLTNVVEAGGNSRKYRHLCRDMVTRVVDWAVARSHSEADAVKRAKRKLHQVHGAYMQGWDAGASHELLGSLPPHPDIAALRTVCRRIMEQHASTRERLPVLDGLYAAIFEVTGVPRRLLDLGCGLHPFALPWMNLPPESEYSAWEVDGQMVALVNRFLTLAGRRPLARWRDGLARFPREEADVILLTKMLPSLEQQRRGCSAELLQALNAPFVVVSFPVRARGGREKGMRAHYTRAMDGLLAQCPWPAVGRVEWGHEVFFVLDKRAVQRQDAT